jgi:endo-1,4-beta-xylanase
MHNGGGGKGWRTGGYKTVGYNVTTLTGYQNFGVYGGTKNPLIEYYISDFGNHGGTKVGALNSDGGTYTVYKQQRVNAPSIIGTATFWQYKSDRISNQSLNANLTITTGNHFNY